MCQRLQRARVHPRITTAARATGRSTSKPADRRTQKQQPQRTTSRQPPRRTLNNNGPSLSQQSPVSIGGAGGDETQVTVDEYVRDQEEERRARRAVAQRVFHTQHDGQPVRINYVRYMDQYLLAVDGPREVAADIDRLIADHVRSKLLLDVAAVEAEQPVCVHEEAVEFLDFRLARVEKLGDKIAAQVPLESIVRDMMTLGYAGYWKGGARKGSKARSHIRPCDRTAWVTRPDQEIIARYNRILQMLYDYYLASSQPTRLKFVLYLLQYSCAMTLAHKHKSSMTKTFSKHGMKLEFRYLDEHRQMQSTSLNLLQSAADFQRHKWQVREEEGDGRD